MTAVIFDQLFRAPSGVRVPLIGASPTAVTNRTCLSTAGYDVQLKRAGGGCTRRAHPGILRPDRCRLGICPTGAVSSCAS